MRIRNYRTWSIDGQGLDAEETARDESELELGKEFSSASEGNLVKFGRIKTQALFGESLIFLAGCPRWTT
jgi:hypothetical protein